MFVIRRLPGHISDSSLYCLLSSCTETLPPQLLLPPFRLNIEFNIWLKSRNISNIPSERDRHGQPFANHPGFLARNHSSLSTHDDDGEDTFSDDDDDDVKMQFIDCNKHGLPMQGIDSQCKL